MKYGRADLFDQINLVVGVIKNLFNMNEIKIQVIINNVLITGY